MCVKPHLNNYKKELKWIDVVNWVWLFTFFLIIGYNV